MYEINQISSEDIPNIDDKITSLEALKKQLEDKLEIKLSNQTHIKQDDSFNKQAQLQQLNPGVSQKQEIDKKHRKRSLDNSSQEKELTNPAYSTQEHTKSATNLDSKKDALIKETLEAIKEKLKKKRKAILEEQQRQKQQELDKIKAQYEEERRNRKESKTSKIHANYF